MRRLERIAAGRTDLVFDHLADGGSASARDGDGVPLIQHCAYYGDVSGVRLLLQQGESLASLGSDLGLSAAAFHGHWRLCELLLERGASAGSALEDTGETPLHAALSHGRHGPQGRVVDVLLAYGADPNAATKPGVTTGCFMRDGRTKGETPLHRAAAYAAEDTIQRLLDAGARKDARDANGDSPLAWASWHLRPDPVLRKLLHGSFTIHPDREPMELSLLGRPHPLSRPGAP